MFSLKSEDNPGRYPFTEGKEEPSLGKLDDVPLPKIIHL